jgi:hypothetical protein
MLITGLASLMDITQEIKAPRLIYHRGYKECSETYTRFKNLEFVYDLTQRLTNTLQRP